jgi:acetyl/propionyl-CoA carboxylase alpha subunit
MAERRYTTTIDGQTFAVRVEAREAGAMAVTVDDGSPELVELMAEGPTLTVLVGDRVLELAPTGGGGFALRGGVGVDVETRRAGARASTTTTSSGTVLAPMPGRIVKLLVGVGDQVAAGAGLVVMEAMKMENEIGAPHAATVARVLVNAGETVDRDAALVELAAR